MKWLPFTILVFVMLMAQLTMPNLLSLGSRGVVPDFLIIFALLIALRSSDLQNALLQAWITGLLHDLSSISPFGIYTLAISLTVWLVFGIRHWLELRSSTIIMLSGLFFTMMTEVIVLIALIVRGELGAFQIYPMLVTIFFCSLYNAVLTPLLAPLVKQPQWRLL